MYSYYGLNRTLCDVLDEIRKLDSTKNYSSLLSLVEEIQSMANRMEAKLGDVRDFADLENDISVLKKEIKKLKKEKKVLEADDE